MAADAVMMTDWRRVGWARSWKFLLVATVRTILSPMRRNELGPPVMCTAGTYVCT